MSADEFRRTTPPPPLCPGRGGAHAGSIGSASSCDPVEGASMNEGLRVPVSSRARQTRRNVVDTPLERYIVIVNMT